MATATELRADLRQHIASLYILAPDTRAELCRALDVVINAVMDECSGPAVTGDARDRLEALLVASYGEVSDMDAFVDEMSRYGIYVLTRTDYDRLVKLAASGGDK